MSEYEYLNPLQSPSRMFRKNQPTRELTNNIQVRTNMNIQPKQCSLTYS